MLLPAGAGGERGQLLWAKKPVLPAAGARAPLRWSGGSASVVRLQDVGEDFDSPLQAAVGDAQVGAGSHAVVPRLGNEHAALAQALGELRCRAAAVAQI